MVLVVLFVFPPFQKANKLPSVKYYFKYLVFARSNEKAQSFKSREQKQEHRAEDLIHISQNS